ncbi:MAG: M61 family peptidase [Gammaproteobacteria bacterium]|nr:M61 family peptidase [Gammaproteobacteria bacterium]
MKPIYRSLRIATILAMLVALPFESSVVAQEPPAVIDIHVDLSDAPRRIFHARLSMPVQPGSLDLLYPKWLPGEHGPTGPITDLVGLNFSADGKTISWRRDPQEMFAFQVNIPAGVTQLDIKLDYLPPSASGQFTAGAATSDRLAVMSWNALLLYPAGKSAHAIMYRPSLTLPAGWGFGTALVESRREGDEIHFATVSLATLVDSPVSAGAHHRVLDLTGKAAVRHRLHLVADSEEALDIKPETEQAFRNLVAEGIALFGSYHYSKYDFLLTLSDHVQSFGLEHHESSDNRLPERTLVEEVRMNSRAGLLPHEFVHSWNAKYRRPEGLTRDNFQTPYQTDLLWVYEGLTSYLGLVLTSRSGLWTPEYAQDALARIAARLSNRPGRTWRPLIDTTRAAQILFGSPSAGSSWRRGVDFYDEGVLIWLEVDTLIRQLSKGRRSLDDFCRTFFGGESGLATVAPYAYADLVAALAEVAPHDWKGFFDSRIYSVQAEAPLNGITNSGWRLVYTGEPNLAQQDREETRELLNLSFSLGFSVSTKDNRVLDVLPGSPAAAGGLPAASTLVAVNGRRWTPEILQQAIVDAQQANEPIRLLVENAEFFSEVLVDYHAGKRHPHLERNDRNHDLLSKILAPRLH